MEREIVAKQERSKGCGGSKKQTKKGINKTHFERAGKTEKVHKKLKDVVEKEWQQRKARRGWRNCPKDT